MYPHTFRCPSSRARTSQSRSQSRSASLCQGRVALRLLEEIEQFEIGVERVAPTGYHYLYKVPRESCQSVPKESCRSVPVQKPTKVLFWNFSIFISLPDKGGKASLLRGWFSQVWRWLRWLPWLRNRVRLFVLSLKDLNKDYKQSSSIMLALKFSVKLPQLKALSTF